MSRRSPMPRRAPLVLAAALLAGLAACRDAPAPFQPPEPQPPEGARRLTFNSGDDRSPAWSPDGDSIYYSAPSFSPFPSSEGLLLSVARTGGQVSMVLPFVQSSGIATPFQLPDVSPAGASLAFVQRTALHDSNLCLPPVTGGTTAFCTPGGEAHPLPRLREIFIRVRTLGVRAGIEGDASVRIALPGLVRTDIVLVPNEDRVIALYDVAYHPFQRAFVEDAVLPYRPSWAPAGDRIVFSDGLRLQVWDSQSGDTTPIPGTDDGVSPAWGPDGEWIAFSQLERGLPQDLGCEHGLGEPDDPSRTICAVTDRIEWPIVGRTLTLVRPDGSERVELVQGEEPAWSPDGETIFFRRGDRLWRIGVSGNGEAPIPGTGGGREPAVSPDGSALAFSRRGPAGDFDIWVLPLGAG